MAIHDPYNDGEGSAAQELRNLELRLQPIQMDIQAQDGMTITVQDTNREVLINLLSTDPLTEITLILPSEQSSRISQRVFVRSQQTIEQFMVTGAENVDNWVASFSPGDNLVYIKSAPNTWSRVV